MKTEIVKYQNIHGLELLARKVREENFFLTVIGDWQESALLWESGGPAYTLMIDGSPEASGGITMLTEKIGECWFLVPVESRHGLVISRHLYRMLEIIIRNNGFNRLQSFIIEGFSDGVKLVERLGFALEGTLKKYGPNGENMHLYARIF